MAEPEGPWSPERAEAALRRAREGPSPEEEAALARGSGGRSFGRVVGALGAAIVGLVYLLNPTAGLIELLPDTLPVVGNLDEAGATLLVFYAVRYLVRGGRDDTPWPPPGR